MTRLGKRIYQDQLIARKDPRGIPYFWIGGPPPSGLAVEGTDFHAVVNRRIAVTPIHLDLTGRRLLKRLRTWDWTLPSDAAGPAGVAPRLSGASRTETAAAAGMRGGRGGRRQRRRGGGGSGLRRRSRPRPNAMEPKRPARDEVIAGPLSAVRSAARRRMRGPFSGGSPWTTDRTCPSTPALGATSSGQASSPDAAAASPALVRRFRAPAASMASWTSSEAPGSVTRSTPGCQPNRTSRSTLPRSVRHSGPDTVQKMSSHTGLDVGQLLPLLAAALPQLVNMLTPNGNVPSGGLDKAAGPNIGGLLGGLLGGSGGAGSGSGELENVLGGLGGMLGRSRTAAERAWSHAARGARRNARRPAFRPRMVVGVDCQRGPTVGCPCP